MSIRVLFDGAYGIRSFGDDAPLIVLAEALTQRLGDVECAVICRHADERPFECYGVRSVAGLEYPTKEESLGRWFRGFNPGDNRDDLCRLYDEVASSDLLVLGAGNFLIDIAIDILKGPVPRFLVMSLMARMTGTPVMWYGISVGPLKTKLGRDMSRLAATLATRITVRDEKSLRELLALDVTAAARQLPDPVLGLQLPAPGSAVENATWRAAHAQGMPVIAVSVRAIPVGCGISHEDYLAVLAQVLDQLLVKQGANVLLIPQCIYTHATPDQDDRNTARDLVAKMQQASRAFVVMDDLDLRQCAALYEGASVAIATRLHGCVFAVMNSVPTLALSYNPKVAEFMNWLGLSRFCLPLNQFTISSTIALVDELLASATSYRHQARVVIESGKSLLDEYTNIAIAALREKVRFPA